MIRDPPKAITFLFFSDDLSLEILTCTDKILGEGYPTVRERHLGR